MMVWAVLKLNITIVVLLIMCMQISQKRLLTSVTVWSGCYYCYFVIAPLLLERNNEIIDRFAWKGTVAFFIAYVLVSIVRIGFPIRCRKNISVYMIHETSAVKSYRIACDYALFVLILTLILMLGREGVLSFLSGNLAAKDYLIKREGIFAELYSFLLGLVGYMILYLFIRNRGKADKRFIVRIAIYGSIVFFFSFTRATILLLLAAVFLYALRRKGTAKQIVIMFILLIIGVLLMIIMGYTRIYGIQVMKELNTEKVLQNLSGSVDFTIVYMDFQREIEYGVHISPLAYLKPVFMIIPRTIWANKPHTFFVQIINLIDPSAMARDYSTGFTVLGEGYAVWGSAGIIVLPFVWGLTCAGLDEIYIRKIKNGTDNDLVTCGYIIFTAYTVVQCHRQGTDAVMVTFIIAMLWLWLCSRIKLTGVKLGFKMKGIWK